MTIEEQHPDINKIITSGDLTKYAEELPYAQAKATLNIIDHGNTSQVLKLLKEYKVARGIPLKAEEKKEEKKGEKKEEKKEEKPNEKIIAAAAVKTGSSSVLLPKSEVDKNDFVGAFNEAVAKDNLKK
jgi:hypothetical protein